MSPAVAEERPAKATARSSAAPATSSGTVDPLSGPGTSYSDRWYAASLSTAALLVIVAGAGLAFGTAGLYGDPAAALGPTPSTAGILVPGWIGHDTFNLAIAAPVLLATLWLARRDALLGLLLWPGALYYVVYTYAIYLIGAPFSGLFLLYVGLVALSAFTTIGVVASIDTMVERERLGGRMPARSLAGLLVVLALLTLAQDASGALSTALAGATQAGPMARPVWAVDLTVEAPAMLIGGVLLWRRDPLGYATTLALLLQYGLTPLALAFSVVLQAVVVGSLVAWETAVGVLVFAVLCFAPIGFIALGLASGGTPPNGQSAGTPGASPLVLRRVEPNADRGGGADVPGHAAGLRGDAARWLPSLGCRAWDRHWPAGDRRRSPTARDRRGLRHLRAPAAGLDKWRGLATLPARAGQCPSPAGLGDQDACVRPGRPPLAPASAEVNERRAMVILQVSEHGRPPAPNDGRARQPGLLIDQFLPRYDLAIVHAEVFRALPEACFRAARQADLLRDPIIRVLLGLRTVPQHLADRLAGRRGGAAGSATPPTFRLDDMVRPPVNWTLLAEEPGRELVLGQIGRPWQPTGMASGPAVAPDGFAAFDRPGFAKIALGLRVQPYGASGTILTLETRVAATDPASRRRFRRYWRLIGPFSHLTRWIALRRVAADLRQTAQHADARPAEGFGPARRESRTRLSLRERVSLYLEPRLDRAFGRQGIALYRWTRGGIARLFRVDVLVLTTRGRRSGRERAVLLAYFPMGAHFVVVAAHGGQPRHPDWYLNLRATPAARVEIGSRTLEVRAEEMSESEANAFWPEIVHTLPGYARYPQRTSRRIPLVRLVQTQTEEVVL